ncbi:tripartite tricarboxylate transporter substrate binding protein [Sabulicella rubraurantiaca]|uniref:tripartite tricarboxylate transporter substrate binding protein n=1 Tax=Sabulicella rubraurantiaca TaxID=2811429 RepID=UPI001A967B8D|nr:tripartite tricarboxylate transporter substrate binding protein [Sabulicella rubraurantiaca]
MISRRALVASPLLLAPTLANAQDFPSKPLRVVVPFAAGGGADIVARLVAPRLGEVLEQPVVVENRAGAGGNLGAEAVMRAPADGHTLLLTSSAFAINPSLYRQIPYHPVRDFGPITRPALMPNILVVPASLPVRSVQELVEHAKSRSLSYASAGVGTGTHLAGEMFKLQTGADLVHVPYRGGGAVVADLIAGRVALTFATLPSVIEFVQNGQLRALAVTTAERWPSLPDVPTMQQIGFPDFEISTWIGLLAPAGTPSRAVNQLHREVVRIIQLPEVRDRFATLGMVTVGDTPEQFASFINSELRMYERLVKASGASLE